MNPFCFGQSIGHIDHVQMLVSRASQTEIELFALYFLFDVLLFIAVFFSWCPHSHSSAQAYTPNDDIVASRARSRMAQRKGLLLLCFCFVKSSPLLNGVCVVCFLFYSLITNRLESVSASIKRNYIEISDFIFCLWRNKNQNKNRCEWVCECVSA